MKELKMNELQCETCHQFDVWFDFGEPSTWEEPEIPPIVYCRTCGWERLAEDKDIEYIKGEYEMTELPETYQFIREMEDMPYQTFFNNIIKILDLERDELTFSQIQDAIEGTIETFEDEIEEIESQRDQYSWELDEAQLQVLDLSDELDDALWQISELESQLEDLEKEHEKEIEIRDLRIDELEDEVEHLKETLDDCWS